MTSNLSKRDLEALSAYLDGQLSSRQRSKLETRLQRDEELRLELANLRRTRAALRDLPQVRAPRQFTLTPEMAGEQIRSASLYPTMRLASALATILFVVVTFGDLITSTATQMSPAILQAQEIVDDSTFVVEPTPAQDLAAENAIEEAAPEAGAEMFALPAEGDGADVLTDQESDEVPAPALEIAPTATQPALAGESAAEDATDEGQEQRIEAESAPQATQAALPTATVVVLGESEEDSVAEELEMEDAPESTQGFVAQPPADKGLEPAVQAEEPSSQVSLPLIRIVEIVLAALALILIGFTFYLRRRV
ncbi:MAG: hypothetical protein DWQ07_14605 [Chloroflexi bacterium]|nr:MAG: hypothetical protein DWQ07_14605 [Chloroflexota bacterium]MBL1195686.1 hypothetical protein [Chloroflexota bacterium]NOH12974.1 hypothetical protein [Chloroflexota bacterium]